MGRKRKRGRWPACAGEFWEDKEKGRWKVSDGGSSQSVCVWFSHVLPAYTPYNWHAAQIDLSGSLLASGHPSNSFRTTLPALEVRAHAVIRPNEKN